MKITELVNSLQELTNYLSERGVSFNLSKLQMPIKEHNLSINQVNKILTEHLRFFSPIMGLWTSDANFKFNADQVVGFAESISFGISFIIFDGRSHKENYEVLMFSSKLDDSYKEKLEQIIRLKNFL